MVYVTVVPPRNHPGCYKIVPGCADIPPDTPVGVHAGGAEAAGARILDRKQRGVIGRDAMPIYHWVGEGAGVGVGAGEGEGGLVWYVGACVVDEKAG